MGRLSGSKGEPDPDANRSGLQHDNSSLWAVTTYFNPSGYHNRLRNYRAFRQHLPIPLLTITLEFGQPELQEDDADIMVGCTEGDVLWQKERLFNIARGHLPPGCDKVVWVDCDVVFPAADWAVKVSAALDRAPVVQPFAWVQRCRLEELSEVLRNPPADPADSVELGAAYLRSQGLSTAQTRGEDTVAGAPLTSAGIAWATRRSLIDEVGFFDAMIIGGGDSAFYSGVSGDPGAFMSRQRSPAVIECWKEWARRAQACSGGQVGYVDNWVIDLWHGQHANRNYENRWNILRNHDFDPRTDLRLSEQGTWLWASDKPAMHKALRDYFQDRREDG